jgi:nudix-type nucleoside diphosphatase (YffH/AdpP family)
VLPYDPVRRTAVLVRLPRAPVIWNGGPQTMLEAPAGMLDGDEPDVCARREAMEETGLRLTTLEPVARAYTSPGMCTEETHLFLAPYGQADRVEAGGGVAEEHEDIVVEEWALADLWAAFEAGGIEDLKTVALVLALRVKHPEAFG